MPVDPHQPMRQIIDKRLLGGAPVHEQQMLVEHLVQCVPCQEYASACDRVVAALGGYSFEVDPALQGKVMAALAQRLASSSERRSMGWVYLAALMLTVAGSFAVGRFSGFAVAAFHLQPGLLVGVVVLWTVPSLCLCMLFPVLCRMSMTRKDYFHENE